MDVTPHEYSYSGVIVLLKSSTNIQGYCISTSGCIQVVLMDKLFHMSACFAKLGYLPYGGPNTVLCFTIGSNCIWTILTIVDKQE